MRPQGQPRAPSTSSPGAGSARTARSIMSRPMCAAAAQFDEARLGLLEYLPKSGQVQGMAGAQIGVRVLHPGRRAAPDPGGRIHPPIRSEANGCVARLSAGQFAGGIPDRADAGGAGHDNDAGRGVSAYETRHGRAKARKRVSHALIRIRTYLHVDFVRRQRKKGVDARDI